MTRMAAGDVKANRRDLSLAHGVWGILLCSLPPLSPASLLGLEDEGCKSDPVCGRVYVGRCQSFAPSSVPSSVPSSAPSSVPSPGVVE
jgi:hypothetical protein